MNYQTNQPLTAVEHSALGGELNSIRAQLSNFVVSVAGRYPATDAEWKSAAVRIAKDVDRLRTAMAVQARTDLADEFSSSLYAETL